MNPIRSILFILAISALGGCYKYTYVPLPPKAPVGSIEKYEKAVTEYFGGFVSESRGTGDPFSAQSHWKGKGRTNYILGKVAFYSHAIQLTFRNQEPINFPYAELSFKVLDSNDEAGTVLYLTEDKSIAFIGGDNSFKSVSKVAEALVAIKALALSAREEFAANQQSFLKKAADHSKATLAAKLSDEVLSLRAKAQSALKDKEFDEAQRHYAKALALQPFWADGHYNRALLLAEIEDYELAILEMQRFIALVPEGPDRKKAQEKVWGWERKAGGS